MGNRESSATGRSRVFGIDESGDHITLGDILKRNEDIKNIVKYSHAFNDHHMKPPRDETDYETDYETEIMYAKKLVAVITPYSPRDIEIPKFEEKPPPFGETNSKINRHDYENYIIQVLKYVAVILSMIRLIPL